MNLCLSSALLLLLVAAFISDRQVTGKCGSDGVADTPWAACLIAEDEEGKVCPHNFLRLDDDSGCRPGFSSTSQKKRVCCLMKPVLDLKIKDAPCLAGQSNDEEEN
ncbi:hypothetical protein ACROYT_G021960 [Oculina patagonica]